MGTNNRLFALALALSPAALSVNRGNRGLAFSLTRATGKRFRGQKPGLLSVCECTLGLRHGAH